MRRPMLVLWFLLALFLIGNTRPTSAHPLGNFTINHLAKIQTSRGVIRVRYVLDIAEIPAFGILQTSSRDGVWNERELDTWAASEVPLVVQGLHVDVDGGRATLSLLRVHARIRQGAGGLSTLYWVADFHTSIAPGRHRVHIADEVYSQRIGWKDIVVAPEREPTHELTLYPNALLGSPRRVTGVSFTVSSLGIASTPIAVANDVREPSFTSIARTNALSDMFSSSNREPLFVLLTMLVAFGLGALHAIEPGHGKALLAFTLVGSRATVRQAAILAASLTFAHTIGVLVLGIVLFFSATFVSESIYPWITLSSGVVIAFIGARNLARFAHRGAHAHTANHHHGDGNLQHTHDLPGSGPIDFRGAVVAAMSGGIAPCPAAIVVMLAALRMHALGYGILLIVVFSCGLASVLTAIGIAVVHGSAWVKRTGRFDRVVELGPLISAILISLIGAVMVGEGFVAQGVHASSWLIATLTALAIAGYAARNQHTHGLQEA